MLPCNLQFRTTLCKHTLSVFCFVEGIGVSNTVAKAAMALTPDKPLAGPFAVGDNYFVIRLKERKEPDLADFEKRRG